MVSASFSTARRTPRVVVSPEFLDSCASDVSDGMASCCPVGVGDMPDRVKGKKSRIFDFLAVEVEWLVGVEVMLRVRVRTM